MHTRSLHALEFDKVLERLARFCLTEAGARSILALVPHSELTAVRHDQNLFAQFRNWKRESAFQLAAFPDMEALMGLARSANAFFDTDALWALREALNQARKAVLSIRELEKNATAFATLIECAQAQALPEKSLSALNRCISDDGLIRDESSPELMLVRAEMRRLHQGCLRQVKDFAARYNIGHFLQDDYMTLASDRYVLPLKSNFKGRLQGIIHDYSQTGETCYFEPMFLVEQNNRLQELKREERTEERRVLEQISALVVQEYPLIENAWNFLVLLDVLCAKNTLADKYQGHCVDINPDAPLCLISARHPLLALDMGSSVQALELVLREADQALIISGGNAGGKTVCLKTLGLINAMNLAGLPCPVGAASSLPWWPRMFAFIGDEQSLDDHVSTFTAQIRHLNQTMQNAGPGTLVLLDEFGVGTDPAQGAALAQAVLDALIEQGSHVFAATHFPALKMYALTREKVRAASVLFDSRSKKPLFCLAYDQVGASQALDVAREHGLNPAIIQKAEQYLLVDGEDSGLMLDKLNALAAEREQELARLRQEEALFKEKRRKLTERFEAEKIRLEGEVRAGIQAIMREWKETRSNHKQSIKALQNARKDLISQESQKQSPSAAAGHVYAVGDWVLYHPWDKKARISELDAKNSKAKVDMNGVFLWAEFAQLSPQGAQSASASPANSRLVRAADAQSSSQRIDLRGKRADLAEEEVLRFLDSAILQSFESVEIIHGRGTGVLRKQVHALLRQHSGVASFNLANEDQGGDGATIAWLR